MALINKLSNIANAIREKTGKTNSLTLEEMVVEIQELQIGGGTIEQTILPQDYLDYIQIESTRVASEVRGVLDAPENKNHNFMISICTSDTHYPLEGDEPPANTPLYEGDMYETTPDNATDISIQHLTMAIKALVYQIPVDFIAHLGDVAHGVNESDTSIYQTELEENTTFVLNRLKECAAGLPLFIAIGNHDAEEHTPSFLYNKFTALSNSENTVFGDSTEYGGYCYRDFDDKRVRVYLLNAGEEIVKSGNDSGATEAQREWLAQSLYNLQGEIIAKGETPSLWKFVVLCHYPLDYGAFINVGKIFAAYCEGASISVNGTNYDYSGRNSIKFLVQYHGHIHNLLTGKLHKELGTGGIQWANCSEPEEYDAWRVAIPNGQYRRDNYYYVYQIKDKDGNLLVTSDDGLRYGIRLFEGTYDLENLRFGYDAIRPKKPGTKKDTSFVVNVMDLTDNRIHSFCYGAGRDRMVDYTGLISYMIDFKDLINVTISNATTSVKEGSSYEALLEVSNEAYQFTEIIITMGGEDITDEVLVDGNKIIIPSVTGDVIIKAAAAKAPTSNLYMIAYSFEDNSTKIYNNGLGYKNGYRLSSNAPDEKHWPDTTPPESQWESVAPGYVMTGCIAWDRETPIMVSGAELDITDTNCRIYGVVDKRNHTGWWGYTQATFNNNFVIETLEEKNKYRITPKVTLGSGYSHFAMSLKGSGEDLVITFGDGEVIYDYKINYDLTKVILDNLPETIAQGETYQATLTVEEGYELDSVQITMGGVDITSTAYNNNIITIESVTGNVTISIIAKNPDVINQIPISTDTEGLIYNNKGYKENTYISSDPGGQDVEASGYYSSGFIPINYGDTVYFKNCTIKKGNKYHRFCPYIADKTYFKYNIANTLESDITKVGTPTYDENGVMTKLVINGTAWNSSVKFLRFCCSYLGEDSIVTINEPI